MHYQLPEINIGLDGKHTGLRATKLRFNQSDQQHVQNKYNKPEQKREYNKPNPLFQAVDLAFRF